MVQAMVPSSPKDGPQGAEDATSQLSSDTRLVHVHGAHAESIEVACAR